MQIQIISCVFLCGGMLVTNWAGRHTRTKKLAAAEGQLESDNLVNGAIFALLGLLIAFSFASAYQRLDFRRQLLISEINAIGTAYLRTDLLETSAQAKMKALFQSYLAARVAYNKDVGTDERLKADMNAQQRIQNEIWTLAIESTHGPDYKTAGILLLPALNEMFDISTSRLAALKTYIPRIIVVMLFALSLICAYLIGYQTGPTGEMRYGLIFAFVITFVLYVIMDIENPRAGWVRLDAVNQQMEQLGGWIGK